MLKKYIFCIGLAVDLLELFLLTVSHIFLKFPLINNIKNSSTVCPAGKSVVSDTGVLSTDSFQILVFILKK